MSRLDLLYVSPTMPGVTGNGLAMRGAMVLEALAADYKVHLLVVPVDDPYGRSSAGPDVSRWCADIAVLPVLEHEHPLFRLAAQARDPREKLAAYRAYPKPSLCRFATASAVRGVTRIFPNVAFSALHVHRLYLAPFVESYLSAPRATRPFCGLDVDDHESRKARRLATLHEAAGDENAAAIQRSEADKYAALEQLTLPRFDRVYACSEPDRLEIARQSGVDNMTVLPNAVRVPTVMPLPKPRTEPFVFLFVGNFGYYPNEDGALHFSSEVLPRLKNLVRRTFRVLFVGMQPSRRLLALSAHSEVIVAGAVADVAGYYRDADAVIVPIRAGGGTRIKLLEAFSHGRPVVSTTIGAEGLDVRHGVELLLADRPDEFAARCADLVRRPTLGQNLAARAFEYVTARHSPAKVLEQLRLDRGVRGLA